MKQEYKITGMHCASCARLIEKRVGKLNQVQNVSVDFSTGILAIESEDIVDTGIIERAVEEVGYKAQAT
ncbi:MAG TPA: cation-transporting ATPase [Candidatus Magasanikbacteria bacterium]|nr:MAG: hypothetical protein A2479_02290 [Candidatus Magasanikbacteria bacterium RIFOXYC2_FULL_39_8]HAT03183.1 cation-transporting ATPase [Candidatus Magasanikbacteria bacterium]